MPSTEKYPRPYDLGRDLTIIQNTLTSIQTGQDKVSQLYPYTVTWTGATTNPSLGNGLLTGYYGTRGMLLWCKVDLTIGSTTTQGTGAWLFSLPFPTRADLGSFIGSSMVIDASAGVYPGVSFLDPAVGTIASYNTGGTFTGLTRTASGVPITWVAGDSLILELEYVPDWESVVVIDETESG